MDYTVVSRNLLSPLLHAFSLLHSKWSDKWSANVFAPHFANWGSEDNDIKLITISNSNRLTISRLYQQPSHKFSQDLPRLKMPPAEASAGEIFWWFLRQICYTIAEEDESFYLRELLLLLPFNHLPCQCKSLSNSQSFIFYISFPSHWSLEWPGLLQIDMKSHQLIPFTFSLVC